MWRRTVALWRKSPRLERRPVAEQLTQINRVRPALARVDGPASGHAMAAIAARMQKTRMDRDIIALRANWLTDRVARASSLIYRAVEPGQPVFKQIENCTTSNVRPSCQARAVIMPQKQRVKQRATVRKPGGIMGLARKRAQRQAVELQNKKLRKARNSEPEEIDELNKSEDERDEEEEGTEEDKSNEEEGEEEGEEEEPEEVEEEESEVPKNKKVLHSKVLIMFIFFQIEFSTDALLV
jgi:hypothetical protein